jgi:small subunit ribosomal protein S15
MLTKRQKGTALKVAQRHEKDTGSPEAQVALLTKSIDALTTHLKRNAKDNHSRRGLLKMVADRRRHMVFLKKTNVRAHNSLAKKLGLKK